MVKEDNLHTMVDAYSSIKQGQSYSSYPWNVSAWFHTKKGTTHGLYDSTQDKEMMMRSSSWGSNLLLMPACPIYPFKQGEGSSPFKMKYMESISLFLRCIFIQTKNRKLKKNKIIFEK
jgi:hypothetical protein